MGLQHLTARSQPLLATIRDSRLYVVTRDTTHLNDCVYSVHHGDEWHSGFSNIEAATRKTNGPLLCYDTEVEDFWLLDPSEDRTEEEPPDGLHFSLFRRFAANAQIDQLVMSVARHPSGGLPFILRQHCWPDVANAPSEPVLMQECAFGRDKHSRALFIASMRDLSGLDSDGATHTAGPAVVAAHKATADWHVFINTLEAHLPEITRTATGVVSPVVVHRAARLGF